MSELITWENSQTHIFGNVYANYEILEGLNFRTDFKLDRRIEEKNYYEPAYVLGDPAAPQFTQAAFADRGGFPKIVLGIGTIHLILGAYLPTVIVLE